MMDYRDWTGRVFIGASLDGFIARPGGEIDWLTNPAPGPRHARITSSIVGLRTVVGNGTELNRVVILGSDFYESQESVLMHECEGKPRIGIGTNCKIENAIIDKNARIGNNVTISPAGKPDKLDHELYFIRDGIVIIPKSAVIPHGTVI